MDERVFNALYETYNKMVEYVVNGLLYPAGYVDDVDDVVQEVWLRVWSKKNFEDRGVKTWIWTIATTEALRYLFNNYRHVSLDAIESASAAADDNEDESFREPTPMDERAFSIDDINIDLERAIEALPMRQRQALLLHHVEDMSHDEIAKLMGCSEQASKDLVKRAVLRLRKTLVLKD